MAMLVKHILRHPSGRVSFRRPYPPELRSFIPGPGGKGPAELKVSLGREGSPGFLSRYEAALTEWDSIVSKARRRQEGAYDRLGSAIIAYLAEAYRVEVLEQDEEARWSLEERSLFKSTAGALAEGRRAAANLWVGVEARRWAAKARETLEASLPEYQRLRAEGDLGGIVECWREEALDLADARGLTIDPRNDEGLSRLCRALNDAAISAGNDRLRRLGGEEVPTPAQPPVPASSETSQQITALGARVPLLSLYDAYAAANEGMTAGVREEWRRYVEKLILFLGHDDAARLTADDLRRWRDLLLQETTKRGTLRSPVTVRDKYITSVRVTLAYGVDEGMLPENIASAVRVKQPKRVKLRERSFTVEEARAILSAELRPPPARMSREHARARRWVPWLCAYTGARVGEMAQLRTDDVLEVEGVWCLRITPEAGRVKTNEARVVPLHPHLIEQGFLDVVRANAGGPLFYDPSRRRVDSEGNRHVKKVGERLAAWVRDDVGITDPNLQPNHGWRHLFKARSYEVVEERMADALQGHAPATTGRAYGAPPIAAKAEAIRKFPRFEV
jgi:integrase